MTPNQTITKEIDTTFDAEELMLMERCVSKIKRHIDRNLENAQDRYQADRMLTAKWYISENF